MTQVNMTTQNGVLIPSSFPADRLRLHYNGANSSCTIIRPSDLLNPDSYVSNIPNNGLTSVSNTHKSVTSKFFGYNAATGGTGGTDNPWIAPTKYNYRLVRSWNTGICWASVNPGNGSYIWTHMDEWVNLYYNAGCDLIFTVAVTPIWASARPTEIYANYGAGSAAEPSNMTYLDTFIRAVAARYGSKIKYYEVYNEPSWYKPGWAAFNQGDLNTLMGIDNRDLIGTGNGDYYRTDFSGTMQSLAIMTKTISIAAKSINSNAKIISSPVTGLQYFVAVNQLHWMMCASDGGSGIMADWVDVIGIHSYNAPTNTPSVIANLKAALNTNPITSGVIKVNPVFINTEAGRDIFSTDLDIYYFTARMFVIESALGLVGSCLYAIGNTNPVQAQNGGNYSYAQRTNVMTKLDNLITQLTTYGIDACSILSPDSITVPDETKDNRVFFSSNNNIYSI